VSAPLGHPTEMNRIGGTNFDVMSPKMTASKVAVSGEKCYWRSY